MKIVVVSDSHGRNDILKTIQEKHPNAKLFIHCGDLEDDPMNYPGYIIVRGNNDYFGRFENERIIKEYIDGKTIVEYVCNNLMTSNLYDQIKDMCKLLYSKNINIDYYPTNFIVRNVDNKLFYIDYECNIYDEKWNYENWGSKYWKKTEEFKKAFESEVKNGKN